MPNNVQIILQLHSSHMLSRLCWKSLKLSFSITWTENFQIFRLDSEKADNQIANIHCIIKKTTEFQKIIHFCLIDYAKAFDYVDHNQYGIFSKTWEYHTTLPASWETYIQVKKQQLEPDMEQQTGSKLGKEYIKDVYCHPVYLLCRVHHMKCWAGWFTAGIKIAGRDINKLR